MSNFKQAFDNVMRLEVGSASGFENDPLDMGGMTWCGISRRHNPNWAGWELIDSMRASGEVPRRGSVKGLDELTEAFYFDKWRGLLLDKLDDSALACKVFQQAVVMGQVWTVKGLQSACNLYGAIVVHVDGVMGNGTVSAINALCSKGKGVYLVRSITAAQLAFHEDMARRKPEQVRFLCGWSNRAWAD